MVLSPKREGKWNRGEVPRRAQSGTTAETPQRLCEELKFLLHCSWAVEQLPNLAGLSLPTCKAAELHHGAGKESGSSKKHKVNGEVKEEKINGTFLNKEFSHQETNFRAEKF